MSQTIAQFIVNRLISSGPCGINVIAEAMERKVESVRREMARMCDAGLVVADIRDPSQSKQFKTWRITAKGRACDPTDPLGTAKKVSANIQLHREISYRKRINAEAEAKEKKRKQAHAEGPLRFTERTKYYEAPVIRHDPRRQVGPQDYVPSIFRAIPLGATLEAA
jgi:predicted transcriptional regulator